MIEELMKFLSINSVYDESTVSEKAPYGEGVAHALGYVAELGKANGFEVDTCDGHATELTYGDGDKVIGIFAHADVVPATGVWSQDPFNPYVDKGRLYARGSSDDKGPFMAAFYATKALIDCGLLKGYKVRFVVGGDEERGSSCLDYYFNTLKKPQPTYGFTPDADFPVICGEKGINDFFPELKVEIPHVKSIKGGAATNAVCDRVTIDMDDPTEVINYCKENNIAHLVHDNEVTILGKSAHGSTPERGDNAAIKTMSILGNVFGIDSLEKLGTCLLEPTGKLWGGYYYTKLMKNTTYCIGMISYEKGKLNFSVNFRYPENVKPVDFKNKFDEFFKTSSKMGEESKLICYDPKTKLIKTLLKAYRSETFDFRKPLTIGGGTYAKHCENTVAFGALFPGRAYVMHQPDEYMPVKDIFKSMRIYAKAIDALGHLE